MKKHKPFCPGDDLQLYGYKHVLYIHTPAAGVWKEMDPRSLSHRCGSGFVLGVLWFVVLAPLTTVFKLQI